MRNSETRCPHGRRARVKVANEPRLGDLGMYRGDLDADWCAREGVGARTQRAGRQAPDRTEPFGSLLEPDEREPTQKRKNARSDGREEGSACAGVCATPRPARGTGRARRESDGSCFCGWRQKTPRIPKIPTHKKSIGNFVKLQTVKLQTLLFQRFVKIKS